jgi:hypothetical protein
MSVQGHKGRMDDICHWMERRALLDIFNKKILDWKGRKDPPICSAVLWCVVLHAKQHQQVSQTRLPLPHRTAASSTCLTPHEA